MKTKVLFIYIDGILIKNVPINYTFDNIIFYTGIITYIGRIVSELKYELILINNQVGIGTENLPRVLFSGLHKFILSFFENEDIYISIVYIDPLKKTSYTLIKMLFSYFSKIYECFQSFIIDNKIILLLKDLDLTKEKVALHLNTSLKERWKKIYNLLKFCFNECSYRRRSKETDIQIFIKIDGRGISDIQTGYGFFDHILDQICIHSNLDLGIKLKGDVHVDEHHSLEDMAIVIGIALLKFLKDKRGITRYGFLLPMDDALVQVAIDLGGRSKLVWKANFEREKIGDVPTEMFAHFFKTFSDVVYCNLYILAEGYNEHHKIEAIFKAFACALKMATNRNLYINRLPSSKEIL